MQADELFQRMQALAAGVIGCECGNGDWKQFLYVEAGDHVIAGCKQCGCTYQYREGKWTKFSDGLKTSQGNK